MIFIATMPKEALPLIKCLMLAEVKAWRDKGLCYNCDKRFSPSHRCKSKLLFFIEDDFDNEFEETMEEIVLEISIHAISGSLSLMQVKRLIKHHKSLFSTHEASTISLTLLLLKEFNMDPQNLLK